MLTFVVLLPVCVFRKRHSYANVWITLFTFLGCMVVYGNSSQTEVKYDTQRNTSLIRLTVPPPVPKETPAVLRDTCPSHCDEEGHKYKAKQCIMPPHCCHDGWLLECCSNASRAISDDIKNDFNCENMASEYWQLVLAVCVPLATLSLIAFLGMTSYLMCRRKRARQSNRQRTGSGSDMSCSSWSVSTISPSNTVRGNPLRSPGSTPDCGSRRHRRGGSGSHNNNNPNCDIFVVGSMNPSIPPPYIDKPPPYSIAYHGPGSNRAFDMVETDSLPDYYELIALDPVSVPDHTEQVARVERETQVDANDACPEYEEIQEVHYGPGEIGGGVQAQRAETARHNNQYEETRLVHGYYYEDVEDAVIPQTSSHSLRNSGIDEGPMLDDQYLQDALQGSHERNLHMLSERDLSDYEAHGEMNNVYPTNLSPEQQHILHNREHYYETPDLRSNTEDDQRLTIADVELNQSTQRQSIQVLEIPYNVESNDGPGDNRDSTLYQIHSDLDTDNASENNEINEARGGCGNGDIHTYNNTVAQIEDISNDTDETAEQRLNHVYVEDSNILEDQSTLHPLEQTVASSRCPMSEDTDLVLPVITLTDLTDSET